MVAACIVCIAGAVLALRAHPLPRWDIRGVRATGSPTVGRKQPNSTYNAGNFEGIDAPWALSALPECLLQQSVWHGASIDAVMPHMPASAVPVADGAVLHYRNCTLEVRRYDALVIRGNDRFHIPKWSRFFLAGQKLVLLRKSRGAELRVYSVSNL